MCAGANRSIVGCTSYQILFVCCRAVSATEDVSAPQGVLEVKSEPGQCAILIVGLHVVHLHSE